MSGLGSSKEQTYLEWQLEELSGQWRLVLVAENRDVWALMASPQRLEVRGPCHRCERLQADLEWIARMGISIQTLSDGSRAVIDETLRASHEPPAECQQCDELICERDRAQDALQDTHIALGGNGEWVARSPSWPPPDSGDLHLDVPELARERMADLERLSAQPPSPEPIGFVARSKVDGTIFRDFAKPGECHPINDQCEWMPVYARSAQPPPAESLSIRDESLIDEAYARHVGEACRRPPIGWHCTRLAGHEGPCAATPVEGAKSPSQPPAPDDARDAARYRFLRQRDHAIVYARDPNAWGHNTPGHIRYNTPEQLDAAIDAACSGSTKPPEQHVCDGGWGCHFHDVNSTGPGEESAL